MATFDDVLEEAGSFGRCPRRVFALLCLLLIPNSGVYVCTVFHQFHPGSLVSGLCGGGDEAGLRTVAGFSYSPVLWLIKASLSVAGITGGDIYIDFLVAGPVEFPAAFLILGTIERIGRRVPFASANIVAGVSCSITAFIPHSKRRMEWRTNK